VDRLVVLREGQIIMDGPKDHVLSRLSQNNQQRS
jgi:ABC-type glutathione transport system ATPase component